MALKVQNYIILSFDFFFQSRRISFRFNYKNLLTLIFAISSSIAELESHYYRFLSVLEPEVLKKIEAVI